MRIAVPLSDEQFCEHFGQSNAVWLCDVDDHSRKPTAARIIPRSPRGPVGGCESFPLWLQHLGVTQLLVGGIGSVAMHRLQELGIAVSPGRASAPPLEMVNDFLADPGSAGVNRCDNHDHHHHHCKHE